jgi:NAD-reducing hydrogenase large subunit
MEHLAELANFGAFPSSHMSLIRKDGAMDLYHGDLRCIDSTGKTIIDHVDYQDYLQHILEEVKDWTYMKFPFLKALGPEKGWYRVGPLARINTCDFIDTPEAEAARKAFFAALGARPCNMTMAYHWARMIELVHAVEKIGELLHDRDLQGTDLVTSGPRRGEAVGLLEAPRGTLFHHFRVDENDRVTMCNLIVSTTHNNEAMNSAVRSVAAEYISGKPHITEGLLNRIEVAIRAYDPCLSCATHALGRMPLVVQLIDHEGNVIEEKARS